MARRTEVSGTEDQSVSGVCGDEENRGHGQNQEIRG